MCSGTKFTRDYEHGRTFLTWLHGSALLCSCVAVRAVPGLRGVPGRRAPRRHRPADEEGSTGHDGRGHDGRGDGGRGDRWPGLLLQVQVLVIICVWWRHHGGGMLFTIRLARE